LENQGQKTKNRHQEMLLVNRYITDWNKLPEGAIGTSHSKMHIFKTRVRKVRETEGDKK